MKKLIVAGAVSLIMTTSLMMSNSMTYAHNGSGSTDNKHNGHNKERSKTGGCHKHRMSDPSSGRADGPKYKFGGNCGDPTGN